MSYERYRVLKFYCMHDRRYEWGVYDLETTSKSGETMTKVFSGTAPEARAKAKELNKPQGVSNAA